MKFTMTKIYDLAESIVSSGYPMLASYDESKVQEDCLTVMHALKYPERNFLGDKHIMRAIKLANTPTGSGHGSFLKGIQVSSDVTMSLKVMKEVQRYVFFQIISSTSTMHRITKMNMDEVVDKFVQPETVELCKKFVQQYNDNPTSENFEILTSNAPSGLCLTFRFNTNYMSLRNMFHQREHHKLEEWRVDFTEWISTLPMSRELIIGRTV